MDLVEGTVDKPAEVQAHCSRYDKLEINKKGSHFTFQASFARPRSGGWDCKRCHPSVYFQLSHRGSIIMRHMYLWRP